MREAEAYDGTSLILAYSHCIAHGIDMKQGLTQQARAVQSGYWPLMRFNPAIGDGEGSPFSLDCPRPSISLKDFTENELRYRMLRLTNPDEAEALMARAQAAVNARWKTYEDLAGQQPR
jgi:pyruvate-ferredoxin/flavodoxin oxidoreductase